MKQRILVAVVGIPLLLAVLCWAPDWATALLLAALSVIAAHELLTAVCGAEKAKRWTALPAVTGALVIAAVYFSGEHYADSPAGTVLRWLIAAAVLALLLEWNRAGNTVVLITHDPKIGAACSRRVYMRDGRLSDRSS